MSGLLTAPAFFLLTSTPVNCGYFGHRHGLGVSEFQIGAQGASMQQFSTTLADSHSPHDQSNSLSLFLSHSLFPQPASDMRLALLLVGNCSFVCVCIEVYLHPAYPHCTQNALSSARFTSQASCAFPDFKRLVLCSSPSLVYFQDQGQRPVAPVSRVENPAALLADRVPRLYLGSHPALML